MQHELPVVATFRLRGDHLIPRELEAVATFRLRLGVVLAPCRLRLGRFAVLALAGWLVSAPAAWAQVRPYIGYAYPAGGQQGTTFQIRLGGQGMDDPTSVLVTGSGISAKVVEYCRRLNNQEVQLLVEQSRELKRATTTVASATMMMSSAAEEKRPGGTALDAATSNLIARIDKRTREFVQTPACASLSSLMLIEVTIAADAEPGEREIRLATLRGISNPLAFHVGQVPEHSRTPMIPATLPILGKESQALRKRPADEAEARITVPCTVNGQIAFGEVNRYRFEARRGQRLVINTLGRQLIPYIADAVPGWFQPVLVLYNADGREVAYNDDFRFKPDPVVLFEVPKDGEYTLAIRDGIYRGREDFVYRISIGELPFVTGIFPLGGRIREPASIKTSGWNLEGAVMTPPGGDAAEGIHFLAAKRKGFVSNRVPFALDTLPECGDRESNNDPAHSQKVTLPITINGRMDKPDDRDVFRFTGRSNDLVVAEVSARRLDSPLDSVIRLTDAAGKLVALNDDREDLVAGVNTHHADSYFLARLPVDGVYYVHIGDTARKGGDEYAYRLRISAPQPDFALRVVPSSLSLRGKSTATVSVHALRKDGFAGPIKLALKDPPKGFFASPVTLQATQTVARLSVRCDLPTTEEPVSLSVIGSTKIRDSDIVREAVPAEDRMQAFLWRHLVPASDLKVMAFDSSVQPPPKRIVPSRPATPGATNAVSTAQVGAATNATLAVKASGATNAVATLAAATTSKPPFSPQQVATRLRQLKSLYEEGLLTEGFYLAKVAECDAAR